jgi:3-oxoacyl-[acyl-carrier protein] reductase
MKARKSGVIVNLTGIGGDLLDPSYLAGGIGNAAMVAFTRSLGSNSHKFGVRVVGINPGACATERYERLARAKAQERYGDTDRWREALASLPFGRPATPTKSQPQPCSSPPRSRATRPAPSLRSTAG